MPKKKTENLNQDVAAERFSPSRESGLTAAQVALRQSEGLFNINLKKFSKSYVNIITDNLCSFFNLLGLIVCVALILVGAKLSNFFFVVIFFTNIMIGIIQEIRAKRCIDKLSLVSNKTCRVVRDGKTVSVSSEEIVLDDVVLLSAGNQIPTDSVILFGDVEVNESLLTGESVPVKKGVGDQLLAGSFITCGNCSAQADKVGKDNYVQILSGKAKKYKKPHSELMSSLKFFIKTIGVIIVPLGAAFIIKGALMPEFDISKTVLGTSTVIIGMIPSGMFLLTSMALAFGIIKLYGHNTLVQDLYSLETLARVDTICFDKTGTITDGQMKVRGVVPTCDLPYEVGDVFGSMLSALNDNNQTAIALCDYFGQNQKLVSVDSMPFNSVRKFSAVSFEGAGTFAFGAPEFLLSAKNFPEVFESVNKSASEGLRVLVLVHSDALIKNGCAPSDFKPQALIIIEDHIREDAFSTVKWFKDNGVAIKVISGDNPVTVSEVSKRVGIDNADKYISLDGLSDNDVYEAATKYTVFGRVNPEQKAIIVKALKAAGHVTAMTGDGVNDILALKEADCAITVAAGSEAARNVSHLVLMDNNFNSMPKVVCEGRRVINNIQSSASLYLMKTIFTMCMGLIILFLPSAHNYPFSLNQMIMLEVFVIGVPSFFLSLQPNDARVKGKFITYVIGKSLPAAALMVLSVIFIEIMRRVIGIFPENVYTSMGVYSLTVAGVVSLFKICKPLNLYRFVLFSVNLLAVLVITCIGVINGFPALELSALWPLSEYWHHLLVIVCLLLLDIPLSSLFDKLFSNVKIKSKRLENL